MLILEIINCNTQLKLKVKLIIPYKPSSYISKIQKKKSNINVFDTVRSEADSQNEMAVLMTMSKTKRLWPGKQENCHWVNRPKGWFIFYQKSRSSKVGFCLSRTSLDLPQASLNPTQMSTNMNKCIQFNPDSLYQLKDTKSADWLIKFACFLPFC